MPGAEIAVGNSERFVRHEVEWTPEKVSRIWDFYASSPAHRGTFFSSQVGHRVARAIDQMVRLRKMKRILDFGCGRGDMIAAMLKYLKAGQAIYGLDFSAQAAAESDRRFSAASAFGGARCAKELPSDFAADHFDLVFAVEVVEHLDDAPLDEMLRECHRLLKKSGYLVLTTPNDEDIDAEKVLCPECGGVFHRWQHVRKWTAESLGERVEGHGFATVRAVARSWDRPLIRLASHFGLASKWGLMYCAEKV